MTLNINSVTKIESSILPAVYPVPAFKDSMYTVNRAVRLGLYEQKFITAEKHRTVSDDFYTNRVIQILSYDKYELKIYAKESANIQHLAQAEQVRITLNEGQLHYAQLLEMAEPVRLDGTENLIYTFIYYDTNPANYKGLQPVNDFLKKTFLLERYIEDQLQTLSIVALKDVTNFIEAGTVYRFYTALLPIDDSTGTVEQTEVVQGIAKPSSSVSQDVKLLLFFLDAEEVKTIRKFLPRCDGYNMDAQLSVAGGKALGAIERIVPTIEQVSGAADLYKVGVVFKMQNYFITPYKD